MNTRMDNVKKDKTKKEKKPINKKDVGKIATKVMAAILALLMILAVAGTLIYYLLNI